jgi:hypothetical protein
MNWVTNRHLANEHKTGMKNLFGRPRPDLLSRCQADYANAIQFAAGALAPDGTTLRVSQTICQNTDKSIMNDGFRSFPSGHSSFSAAGLVYLSLFLAAKLSITIPFLTPQAIAHTNQKMREQALRERNTKATGGSTNLSGQDDIQIAARDKAASPPLYLLIFAAIPPFAAICRSRKVSLSNSLSGHHYFS